MCRRCATASEREGTVASLLPREGGKEVDACSFRRELLHKKRFERRRVLMKLFSLVESLCRILWSVIAIFEYIKEHKKKP